MVLYCVVFYLFYFILFYFILFHLELYNILFYLISIYFILFKILFDFTSGPKESQKLGITNISKKSFLSPPMISNNKNGNDIIKKYTITKKGVSSPILIDILLHFIDSGMKMFNVSDKAVIESLLSINLIQLLSCIIQWEVTSVYKIKTVYSSLNSLLRRIRYCITNLRKESIISSFYSNSDFLNIDTENIVCNDSNKSDPCQSDVIFKNISNENISIENVALCATKFDVNVNENESKLLDKKEITSCSDNKIEDINIENNNDNDNNNNNNNNDDNDNDNDNENDDNDNENEYESQKEISTTSDEDVAIELLMQLSCVISSYIGLLSCSLLKRESHRQVRIYEEME